MYKKIILIVIFLFGFSFSVFAESIKNYEVSIFLNKDASMDVIENIDYDFKANRYDIDYEDKQKHGIFRFIPNHFQVQGQEKLKGLRERKLEFSNLKVYVDGQKAKIAEENKHNNGNYFIKIGDKDIVLTGLHRYTIKYKVQGALRYFDDYDEIYWNAIGLDWKVAIDKAKVILSSDKIQFQNKACYQGKLGSKVPCDIQDNIFSATGRLNHNEGLTIAASFPKGSVQKVELWGWSIFGWIAILSGIMIFCISMLLILTKRYLNKFKFYAPIIPIYEPYKNYHPAVTGFLIDKKLDPQDITAGILSLAQKGIIEIERIEKDGVFWGKNIDYIFRLKKKLEEMEDELDMMFVLLIFGQAKDILYKTMKDVNIKSRFRDKLKSEVALSDFVDDAKKVYAQRKNIGLWVEDYANKNGIIEKLGSFNFIYWIFLGIFSVVAILIYLKFLMNPFWIMLSIYVFLFPLLFLFVLWKYRYTKQGWEAKNSLEGFKLFLEMTEKERIRLLNAPELNPKQFFEYLPYATAFGVEKKWKKQFKNITLAQPDWYKGNEALATGSIISDISHMSTIISSTIRTTSSGSSGGGSSGGGGGGGGGGSW